jgi:phosphoglycerol transferase MdoB-like AlkP superfamily enzyme
MPTICNLFGLDYDSRLVMGRDILSDSEALVIFNNHSFLTDKGRYDAATDVFYPAEGVTWESDEEMEEYASAIMNKVNKMFDVSAKVIDYDYYSTIFKDGAS